MECWAISITIILANKIKSFFGSFGFFGSKYLFCWIFNEKVIFMLYGHFCLKKHILIICIDNDPTCLNNMLIFA